MAARKSNPSYLNGVPELLILHLLSLRPMYGYELVAAIKAASGERLDFGEGCVYPILHKLEGEELLLSSRETVSGRSRIVYRTSARGREQLAEAKAAWLRVAEGVRQALSGGEDGLPALA